MQVLNPRLRDDLAAGRPVRLDLGCGERPRAGFYAVDHLRMPNVDAVADLNAPLDALPDDSVDEIYTRHVLEHVTRLPELIAELHRVTRPGGRIEVVVPHFSNPYYYSDPTHVRFFGLYTFFYYCDPAHQPRRKVPSFYSGVRFTVDEVRLTLLRQTWADKALRAVLEPLVNAGIGWQDWYERRLCRLFPADGIRYVVRPVKATAAPARLAA